jgi:hypothetical protein
VPRRRPPIRLAPRLVRQAAFPSVGGALAVGLPGLSLSGNGTVVAPGSTLGTPNPLALPQADLVAPVSTLTANYTATNALNLPSQPAGYTFTDPVTGCLAMKLTSNTIPVASTGSKHNGYSDGGNFMSHAWQSGSDWYVTISVYSDAIGQSTWLVDMKLTGSGAPSLTNWRQMTGQLAPQAELCMSFSSNRATPRIAYVVNGSTIRRVDTATMTVVNTGNFPKAGLFAGPVWLFHDRNDEWFCWTTTSGACTSWNSQTNYQVTASFTANEGRMDREGGGFINLSEGAVQHRMWDSANNVYLGTSDASPSAHCASLRRRWMGTNWDLASPGGVWKVANNTPSNLTVTPSLFTSGYFGGGSEIHWSGNWDQDVSGGYDQQWAVCAGLAGATGMYARKAVGMLKADGTDARTVGFHLNCWTGGDYWELPFANISPGGHVITVSTRWATSDTVDGQANTDLLAFIMPRTGGL